MKPAQALELVPHMPLGDDERCRLRRWAKTLREAGYPILEE